MYKLLLIFLLICSCQLSAQEEIGTEISKMSDDTLCMRMNNEYQQLKKSPSGALLRSAIIPGWGITYAYDRKGIIAATNILGPSIFIMSSIINARNNKENKLISVSITCSIALYLYLLKSSFDFAQKHNSFLKNALYQEYNINCELGCKQNSVKLIFSYHW